MHSEMFAAQGTAVQGGVSLFVPGQHDVSDTECPSLGSMGVRTKPLGGHFIWSTALYVTILWVSMYAITTFYLCSLPHQLSGLVCGLDNLHHNMGDFCLILDSRCLLFTGLALLSGRVLMLKVILHNTPKAPRRQGQECSRGVTDGKAIVTMIGPSTVQN